MYLKYAKTKISGINFKELIAADRPKEIEEG
jgi:hypothetical protein